MFLDTLDQERKPYSARTIEAKELLAFLVFFNARDTADLVIFTEETLNGKLYFLCSGCDEH